MIGKIFTVPGTKEKIQVIEKRKPKKGEYYISGALPAAYIAPCDLDSEYWIAVSLTSAKNFNLKIERNLVIKIMETITKETKLDPAIRKEHALNALESVAGLIISP